MAHIRVSWVAVGLSFIGAAVLELLLLPSMLNPYRAEWIVLTIIYWVLRHPESIGIFFAFCVGLLLDVISGSYLGVQALACSATSYLVLSIHQRLKMFPIVQQSLVVFVIVGIQLMIVSLLRSVLGGGDYSFAYLLAAGASAVMWPFVLILTDRLNFFMR